MKYRTVMFIIKQVILFDANSNGNVSFLLKVNPHHHCLRLPLSLLRKNPYTTPFPPRPSCFPVANEMQQILDGLKRLVHDMIFDIEYFLNHFPQLRNFAPGNRDFSRPSTYLTRMHSGSRLLVRDHFLERAAYMR